MGWLSSLFSKKQEPQVQDETKEVPVVKSSNQFYKHETVYGGVDYEFIDFFVVCL